MGRRKCEAVILKGGKVSKEGTNLILQHCCMGHAAFYNLLQQNLISTLGPHCTRWWDLTISSGSYSFPDAYFDFSDGLGLK